MPIRTSSLPGCVIMPSTNDSQLYSPAQQVFWCCTLNDLMIYEIPPLTVQGKERAEALTLRDAGVIAIKTSQWLRAKDTAQPVSRPA